MKNYYILLLIVLITSSVQAQKQFKDISSEKKHVIVSDPVKPEKIHASKGITIWQNDFSDNSEWTYDNTSAPYLNWEITTAADTIPVAALSPAIFTTVANGFAFINSDSQGQNGVQNANMTYNGTINCTGYPNVSLVFEQQYRTYLDTRIVRVSNDGGITWTDFYITDGNEPTAQNSANPDIASVNISSVAGNQANVKIQLNYQGNWGWYWAVDDIKVIETDQYDLKLQSIAWGTDGAFGERLPYYQVPTLQVAPINFGGALKNIGVQDISDATFTAVINAVYSGSTPATFIAASNLDTVWCGTTFTPAATVATHVVQLAASTSNMEPDMTNNVLPSMNIEINTNIYARDRGTILGGISNAGEGYEVGNVFDIFTNDVLYGIDAYIHPTAEVGSEIFTKLYYNNTSTGVFDFVDESAPYVIQAGDLGQKITLPLQNFQALLANESYLAMVGSFGDGGISNDLVCATSGSSAPQTAFYYDYTDQTWYYTSSSPMVRMNFDPSLGIEASANAVPFTIYPNPSNDQFTVKLSNGNNATIEILDLKGNSIKKTLANSMQTNVSTASISNGVYLLKITTNGNTFTKKIVVQH